MGYWKKVTLIKKKLMGTVSHDSWFNLRDLTGGVGWKNERVFLNQNNFMIGYDRADIQRRIYYGLSFAVANPKGSNLYNTQIGIVKVNSPSNSPHHGLIHASGNEYNSNITNVIFSGTFYAFLFMLAYDNKRNGLVSNSGFNVYANNVLISQQYIENDYGFLNNFCVAQYTGGWTGNIEIRPIGNRNFKVGYENFRIHNLFIYTQPVTFYPNTATYTAIEGDI